MEMLVCPKRETKSRTAISQRWQVSYRTKRGVRKIKVYPLAECAARKSDELFDRGIQSKIQPVLTDFYVIDGVSGRLVLCKARLHPQRAAKIAKDYASIDREAGVLLWPHGTKLPKSLQSRVVVADKGTEVVS